MKKLLPHGRVIRCDRQISERTDPNYWENTISKIAKDYQEIPSDWKQDFLKHLPQGVLAELKKRELI